jgi:hypothetical protein
VPVDTAVLDAVYPQPKGPSATKPHPELPAVNNAKASAATIVLFIQSP